MLTLNVFVSRVRHFVSFVFDCSITRISDAFLLSAYVKFADRVERTAARVVMPSVRMTTVEMHARLALIPIRLS